MKFATAGVVDQVNSTKPSSTDQAFDYYGMTNTEVVALTATSVLICVIGTVSNSLVIFAVVLTQQLRETCTAVLLTNLSACDLLICVVYVPTYIYDINYGSSQDFEAVRFRIGFGLLLATLNSQASVTLDRFISICYPYRYIALTCDKSVIFGVVCAQWFIAIGLSLLGLLTDTPLYSFVYIALLIILIISLHVAMYCVARREIHRVATQYPTVHDTASFFGDKATKVIAIVVAASLLCWLPILILPAAVSPSSPSFKRYIKITLAFTSLSSAVDPFIFCWRLNDFRMALNASVRKIRHIQFKY